MQRKTLTIVNFGARFQSLVEKSGLSQKDLAAALGVSEGSIVNYKGGRIPKAEELLAISAYFGLSMEQLLTGQADPTPRSPEASVLKQARAEAEKLLRQLDEVEETTKRLRLFLG